MNLADLRKNVRRQTETLPEELPDSTIDWYIQQAFDRQIAFENDWPFFEKTWEIDLAIDATSFDLPADVNPPGINTLRDVDSGLRLMMIAHSQADDWFGSVDPSSTYPAYFSLWSGKAYLWPQIKFADIRRFQIRGHRKPVDWLALGPDGEPDCDPRLHAPMIHYAIALAYVQQEDETLENVYMTRWQHDFAQAHTAIMEPVHNEPLIMAPHFVTPIGHSRGRPRAIVNVPGGP